MKNCQKWNKIRIIWHKTYKHCKVSYKNRKNRNNHLQKNKYKKLRKN